MSRFLIGSGLVGLLTATDPSVHAFTPLGPFAITDGAVWQVPRIGYNLPGDIGGPMNAPAGEEYRWNTKVIVYAYDGPFFDFFGTRGMEEVEKAIKIFNDLPPASTINVDDYPMRAESVNFRAAALGLLDLKSIALWGTIEQLGLAGPQRWVYTLRNRFQPGPNRFPVFFNVIRRNFDPVTVAESVHINGRLWTYVDIVDLDTPPQSFTINSVVDPTDFGRFDPVANALEVGSGFGVGSYFTGLTRDDVGGLKYIYRKDNRNFETVLPDATGTAGFGGGGGSPWDVPPPPVTNAPPGTVLTNNFINPAIREGIDNIVFVRAEYDSLIGQFFTPFTNRYSEVVITNGNVINQTIQRAQVVPDILFTARDLHLGAEPGGIPATVIRRTTTGPWQNGDGLLAGAPQRAGPGIISHAVGVPVEIAFNNVGFFNGDTATGFSGNAVFGVDGIPTWLYGAFDGTTNAPIIFSQGGTITIEELERIRLGQ